MTSNQPPYGDPHLPTGTRYPEGTGMPDTTADSSEIALSTGSDSSAGTGYAAGTTAADTSNTGQSSTREAAAGEASEVKDHAVEAGRDVAQTAQSEAASVAGDVKSEIRGLFDSSMSEVRTQAGAGQSRLATGLRSLAGELGELSQGSTQQGTATRAVQELASYGDNVAGWLENREPADVLDEVRRFAARRPVAFLAIAAGAGLLVGRFARGLQADRAETDTSNAAYRTQPVQDHHQPRFGGNATDPVWNTAGTMPAAPSGDPLYAERPGSAADPAYPTEGDVRGLSSQHGMGQYGHPGVQR